MKIDHLAMWVKDLELMKNFYMKYFNLTSGEKYSNPKKQFTSYFLKFSDENTRLELMHNPSVALNRGIKKVHAGLAHIALSVGSKEKVDELTEQLRSDKLIVVSEPRITGDGCYESVILDPEGNSVEITV